MRVQRRRFRYAHRGLRGAGDEGDEGGQGMVAGMGKVLGRRGQRKGTSEDRGQRGRSPDVHTGIRAYMHTCIHTCVRAYVQTTYASEWFTGLEASEHQVTRHLTRCKSSPQRYPNLIFLCPSMSTINSVSTREAGGCSDARTSDLGPRTCRPAPVTLPPAPPFGIRCIDDWTGLRTRGRLAKRGLLATGLSYI